MSVNESVLKAILDAYPYEVVFVNRDHTIQYLNKAAKERYGSAVQVGQSIFDCHNEESKAKIEAFLKRADAGEQGEFFETLNPRRKERDFFVPVRDENGKVIGYFERHEKHWDLAQPQQPVVKEQSSFYQP